MRLDCINQCFGEGTRKINENCIHPFYYNDILWRNDSPYSSYNDLKLCNEKWFAFNEIAFDESEQVKINCESKCRPDCVNRYYQKKKDVDEEVALYHKVPNITTRIEFYHNNMPDQVTQHLEKNELCRFLW